MKNSINVFMLFILMGFSAINAQTYTNPANNSVGQTILPTFNFTFANLTPYTLKIATGTTAGDWATPYYSAVVTTNGAGLGVLALPEANRLSNGVIYYWSVDNGTTYAQFTTVTSAQPYLNNPTNGAILSGASTTLSWATGATGLSYVVQIAPSTDPTFLAPGGFLLNVSTTNSYYSVLNTLFVQGGTYYWRVIAKNVAGTVVYNYSNIWQFSMPGLPTSIASYPTGNVTIYNNPPTLYWYPTSYNPKVTEYLVHYKNVSGIGTDGTLIGASATEGCFTTASTNPYTIIPFALTAGTRYYWRVAAYDGSSDKTLLTNWSPEESFTVYGSVSFAICYPTFPTSGTSVSGTPTFYWYASVYSPVLFYKLEIDDAANFGGGVLITKSDISSGSYTLTTTEAALLTSGNTYYWRVSASFSSGGTYGPVSANGSFIYSSTSTTVSIATPYPSSPTSGTVVGVTNPTLIWSVYSVDPLQFRVTWATNPAINSGTGTFTTASGTSGWMTSNSYILGGLTAGATYYWQVQARLATTAVEGGWSTVAWFTTAAGSASVVPLAGSPVNGIPINNTSATLSWILPTQSTSTLKYEVQYSKQADFGNAVTVSNLDKPSIEIKNLDQNSVYYWRASSKTSGGVTSSYSAPTSFNTGSATAVESEEELPAQFELSQNYPNPFNPTTVISFQLSANSFVTLKIYDMLGREIKTLASSQMNAGKYNLNWNGEDNYGSKVASGAYIYRITAGSFISTKKMVLLK